ncbi:MAG: lipase family protein [Pseudomonadota bacterium]
MIQDHETLKLCLELAKISKAAYAGPINHRQYTLKGEPFTDQKIIHGSHHRGYCRVFWNDTYAAIAFRGTRESVDWSIANFKAFPVPLRDCDLEKPVRVHRGFQRTLDYGDKTTRLRSLDAIFSHLEEHGLLEKRIVITGHSMGGALALLFAVKFRARYQRRCDQALDAIVTFAAPSVGLRSFKRLYGDLAPKTLRFVNDTDIVPFTPPAFYHHVGEEIWLRGEIGRKNPGWPRRFAAAVRNRFQNAISDHAITQYICKIEERIAHSALQQQNNS